jgi:hypothetical protein
MSSVSTAMAYAGDVAHYALYLQYDKVIWNPALRYQKQSSRNHLQIAGPNGKLKLTIPVQHPVNYLSDKEVKISWRENWQKQHWRTLETCYNSSPFFKYYQPEFLALYQQQPEYLLEWNLKLHQLICRFLDIRNFALDESGNNEPIVSEQDIDMPPYYQTFADRHGFIQGLSILDLLFNEGPQAKRYLSELR